MVPERRLLHRVCAEIQSSEQCEQQPPTRSTNHEHQTPTCLAPTIVEIQPVCRLARQLSAHEADKLGKMCLGQIRCFTACRAASSPGGQGVGFGLTTAVLAAQLPDVRLALLGHRKRTPWRSVVIRVSKGRSSFLVMRADRF